MALMRDVQGDNEHPLKLSTRVGYYEHTEPTAKCCFEIPFGFARECIESNACLIGGRKPRNER